MQRTPTPNPSESWSSGERYEPFIGRWSRLVADQFVSWLSVPAQARWLDLGCGTGALSDAVLRHGSPARLLGIDPSEAYVTYVREHIADPRASFDVVDAAGLTTVSEDFDAVVSGLVLNFLPDRGAALSQMRRAAGTGGTVAGYVWDYPGEMWPLRHFWDAAVDLDPAAEQLHEGRRFDWCRPAELEAAFTDAGFAAAECRAVVIPTVFESFDDYWAPFLGGQGPAPSYVRGLTETRRHRLRAALAERLPRSSDGSIQLTARAWAVRGVG
jgi:SAM-dependent methyltransferase